MSHTTNNRAKAVSAWAALYDGDRSAAGLLVVDDGRFAGGQYHDEQDRIDEVELHVEVARRVVFPETESADHASRHGDQAPVATEEGTTEFVAAGAGRDQGPTRQQRVWVVLDSRAVSVGHREAELPTEASGSPAYPAAPLLGNRPQGYSAGSPVEQSDRGSCLREEPDVAFEARGLAQGENPGSSDVNLPQSRHAALSQSLGVALHNTTSCPVTQTDTKRAAVAASTKPSIPRGGRVADLSAHPEDRRVALRGRERCPR
jgi:hypothetical protein